MKIYYALLFATVFALAGCSGKDDNDGKFSRPSLILNYEDTYDLFKGTAEVSSTDEFVATVTEDGVVTAGHLGVATIRSGNQVCEVSVVPVYDLYYGPYLGWGDPRSAVSAAMGGAPDVEIENAMLYVINLGIDIMYIFDVAGGLEAAVAVVDTPAPNIENFLLERYNRILYNPNAEYQALMSVFTDSYNIREADLVVEFRLMTQEYYFATYLETPGSRSPGSVSASRTHEYYLALKGCE